MTKESKDKIADIEARLPDINQGYNTGNLQKVYAADVALLLREVRVLELECSALTKDLEVARKALASTTVVSVGTPTTRLVEQLGGVGPGDDE